MGIGRYIRFRFCTQIAYGRLTAHSTDQKLETTWHWTDS